MIQIRVVKDGETVEFFDEAESKEGLRAELIDGGGGYGFVLGGAFDVEDSVLPGRESALERAAEQMAFPLAPVME